MISRRLLAAAAALLLAAPAVLRAAPARGAEVAESYFCLKRDGRDCPARAGASVSLSQLPRGADGRRVIYFFSRMKLETGRVAFLVVDRVGSCYGRSRPKLYVNPRLRTSGWASFWDDVTKRLKAFALSPKGQGLLAVGVIAPPRSGASPGATQRIAAFAEREMTCAGKVLGRVVDFDGKPLAGENGLRELTVTP